MTCEQKEAYSLGVSIGVLLVLFVMWYPLQNIDKQLEERINKLEAKHYKKDSK